MAPAVAVLPAGAMPAQQAQPLPALVARATEAPPITDRLAALAAEIRQGHSEVGDAARTAAERAIGVGNALLEAKHLIGHGNWLPWLKANAQLSARQAQRYMQVAKMAADGKYVLGDAFDIKKVTAALAPERRRAATAHIAREPAEPHRKALPSDMRSAVEALAASDAAMHREFLVAACEALTDIGDIVAVVGALLNRLHPHLVVDVLVEALDHPRLAENVAVAILGRAPAEASGEVGT
jgi:Protein of unknown function (DUF3102)